MTLPTETELKLQVTPGALRALGTHRLLRSRVRAVTSALYGIYFDTPDLDLRRIGVALRLRRNHGRWVQTLKGGGGVQGGLHCRIELETEVAAPFPDFAAIRDPELAGIFASPQVRAQLRPLFVTDMRRTLHVITSEAGNAIEVCLDRGEIKSGDRIEALCEVELELKSGSAVCLFDLALRLLDIVPLRIENRSKAERGYALFSGEPAAPVKSRAAALTPEMNVEQAFRAIAWATLAHLQANERGMLEGADPEYLHQMRVALRRFRSAFGVFRDVLPEAADAFAKELKWLAGALGPARDWDVFITETLPPIRASFGEHAGLAEFEKRCAQVRLTAGRRAHRAVNSKRYQRLMLGLGRWLVDEAWADGMVPEALDALRAPVRGFVDAVLARRASRVAKRGAGLRQRTGAELHELRIAVKKLRYTADFFSALYDAGRVRETLGLLARLQDTLGVMNDAEAVAGLMQEGFGAKPGRTIAEARGIMLGWSRGRAETLKRELRAAWKAYRAAGHFW
ncbi:MAG: CHAD domain-containing protein [Burkholderiales bacterium]|nr:CHAD domain-containing protein [Burkholderiales bacterium]